MDNNNYSLLYMKKRQKINSFRLPLSKGATVLNEQIQKNLTFLHLHHHLLLRWCWSDAWTRILIMPSSTILRARPTRSSSKVAKPVCSLPAKALCHFALGLQFCLSVRERSMWMVVVVGGKSPEQWDDGVDRGQRDVGSRI